MVVKLRLARFGQRNRPFYRIVAADSKSKRDGRHLEVVGRYNPLPHSSREADAKVKRVWLNIERIKYWIASGAHISETVARLLGTSGLLPISPRTVSPSPSATPSPEASDSTSAASVASASTQKRAFGSAARSLASHSVISSSLSDAMRPSPNQRGVRLSSVLSHNSVNS